MTSLKSINPYKHIRGFNYMPSYLVVLNDVIDHYDEQVIRRELGWAHQLGINSVRMWFSEASYRRDPNHFLRSFENLLSILKSYNMTIMPTFFNRWVDYNYPIGQLDEIEVFRPLTETKKKYIQDVVSAFRYDPAILMWDMCNEPFYSFGEIPTKIPDIRKTLMECEVNFFMQTVEAVKAVSPSQPLTIGMVFPSWPELDELCKALDVLSFHPYADWWNDGFKKTIEQEIEYANKIGKALICTETCQGSLDDTVREQCIRASLGTLNSYDIGWYAWVLCAGQMVSTRRDRTDGNAKPGDRGYMCFFNHDGSLRQGHDCIRNFI